MFGLDGTVKHLLLNIFSIIIDSVQDSLTLLLLLLQVRYTRPIIRACRVEQELSSSWVNTQYSSSLYYIYMYIIYIWRDCHGTGPSHLSRKSQYSSSLCIFYAHTYLVGVVTGLACPIYPIRGNTHYHYIISTYILYTFGGRVVMGLARPI